METIAFIILVLYFLYKLVAGIFVYWAMTLDMIQEQIPSIVSKRTYVVGIVEHLVLLILTIILYSY